MYTNKNVGKYFDVYLVLRRAFLKYQLQQPIVHSLQLIFASLKYLQRNASCCCGLNPKSLASNTPQSPRVLILEQDSSVEPNINLLHNLKMRLPSSFLMDQRVLELARVTTI